ncbi:hypothetical protein QTL95_19450 [Rhizobium sp. S152]|uniref:hypothetical protein n=1 Tax=Rhizobium sp. S152 TaxID=3055038 RepID=UPI0025A967E4|nr:hypothetical protein [Rhizobium sp. S152]MDM9628071.1 hypothetical protein [Rhizobium sp. S152]
MTSMIEHNPATRKVLRGRAYDLAEFTRRYRLNDEEAKRLFDKFGPSATELDLLMAAKRRQPVTLQVANA